MMETLVHIALGVLIGGIVFGWFGFWLGVRTNILDLLDGLEKARERKKRP